MASKEMLYLGFPGGVGRGLGPGVGCGGTARRPRCGVHISGASCSRARPRLVGFAAARLRQSGLGLTPNNTSSHACENLFVVLPLYWVQLADLKVTKNGRY